MPDYVYHSAMETLTKPAVLLLLLLRSIQTLSTDLLLSGAVPTSLSAMPVRLCGMYLSSKNQHD